MDHDIVTRVQRGDEQAFESLVRADFSRLYRVARGVLGDPHLAEYATQQAFVEIWRGHPPLARLGQVRGLVLPAARSSLLRRGQEATGRRDQYRDPCQRTRASRKLTSTPTAPEVRPLRGGPLLPACRQA